jgi:hypothetical protein
MYELAKVGDVERAIAHTAPWATAKVVAVCDSKAEALELIEKLNRPDPQDDAKVAVVQLGLRRLIEQLKQDEVTWRTASASRAHVIARLEDLRDDAWVPMLSVTVATQAGSFATRDITPGPQQHRMFGTDPGEVILTVDWKGR